VLGLPRLAAASKHSFIVFVWWRAWRAEQEVGGRRRGSDCPMAECCKL
jgi:hypothetical protein